MGNVTLPNTLTNGQPADATQVMGDFDAIDNVVNGSIDNSNIATGAAIDPTKISGTAVTDNLLPDLNAKNYIWNPFLFGTASPLSIPYWTPNSNASLTLNDTAVTDGTNSVADSSATDLWVLQQTIGTSINTTSTQSDVNLVPAQTYTVSANVKTSSGGSTVYLDVQNATSYSSLNSNIASTVVYHTGGGSYERIYSVFTVPASCQQITIALVKAATTTAVTVSDFTLTIGSNTLPVQSNMHQLASGDIAFDYTLNLQKSIDISKFGLSDYILSGLTIPTSSSLSATSVAGTAFIKGVYIPVASDSGHTYTASKDTYVDVDNTGTYHYNAVSNGASAPSLTSNSIRIAKVVTSGTAVTNVYTGIFDSNYVWIYPTSPVQAVSPLQMAQMKYKCAAKLGADGTTQSIANNTNTLVALSTTIFDPNSNFNTSTYKYTCPIAGFYLVVGTVWFNGTSSSGSGNTIIDQNDVDVKAANAPFTSSVGPIGVVSGIIQCASGDTLSLHAYQSTGSSVNIQTTGGSRTSLEISFLSA